MSPYFIRYQHSYCYRAVFTSTVRFMATFLTTLKTGRRTGRAEGGAVTAMYLGERLRYNRS